MKTLTVRIRGSVYLIPQEDIIYLENERRKIHLYMENEEYLFYGTFRQVLAQLDGSFLHCSRSFIMNKKHIQAFCNHDQYEVVLDNGVRIPLSKRLFDRAKSAFEAYLEDLAAADNRLNCT